MNSCTVATDAAVPPPKISSCVPTDAPAASCSGLVSAPSLRACPLPVLMAVMPLAEVLAAVSPPSRISRPPGPARATSRLSGACSFHGSRPDSTAGIVACAIVSRSGGAPVVRAAVPMQLARITPSATRSASSPAVVRARRTRRGTRRAGCRRACAGACRLPGAGAWRLPGGDACRRPPGPGACRRRPGCPRSGPRLGPRRTLVDTRTTLAAPACHWRDDTPRASPSPPAAPHGSPPAAPAAVCPGPLVTPGGGRPRPRPAWR